MRWLILPALLISVGCQRPTTPVTTAEPASSPPGPTAASATTLAPTVPQAATANGATRATRKLRVYVAGESIERRVRWVERPFLPIGALNERGADRNDDGEYGWVVPFAERLSLRAPHLSAPRSRPAIGHALRRRRVAHLALHAARGAARGLAGPTRGARARRRILTRVARPRPGDP